MTITTTNDFAFVTEGSTNPAATGNVLAKDSGTGLILADIPTSGTFIFGGYGRIKLFADGSYQYTLDNSSPDVQNLSPGETVQEQYPYVATDGIDFVQGMLTVNITGIDQTAAPVAVNDAVSVSEDGTAQVIGNVLANDAGIGLTVQNPGLQFGGYGGLLNLSTDGSYQYTLDNSSITVQSLREGEVVTEEYNYSAVNSNGSASALLIVQIIGQNDAPVTADDAASLSEDGMLTASGNVLTNDSDVDAATLLAVAGFGSFAGAYGTLELNADGSYTYTLANDAVQSLQAGETASDVFTYLAADGIASTEGHLTFAIAGANDAPVALADTATVLANASGPANGSVLNNDSDVDAGTLLRVVTPGTYAGAYGTLLLAQDGSYAYVLDATLPAVQALRPGEQLAEVFDYAATDGITSAASTLTVTIDGVNDAPVTQNDSAFVQEDVTLTASGNVLLNDTDPDGTALSLASVGLYFGAYGQVVLAADGSYTYTLDNAAAQSLRAGEVVEDIFQYSAADDVQTSIGQLTIQIAGSDDAPVTVGDVASVREDVTLGATGNVLTNDTDADSGVLSVTAGTQAGAYGTLALNADGSYTYTLANDTAAVQLLCGGQVVSDTFSYSASDGIDSTPGALTISVLGSNDTPVLANSLSDQDAQVGAEFTLTAPANTFRDIDLDDALTYSAHTAAGAALPSWLSFDPTALRFSGTPGTADAGMLQVRLTATDISGASADDMFAIDVTSANHDLTFDFQVNAVWPNSTYDRENVGSPGVKGTHQDVSIDGKNRTYGMYVGGDGSDTLNGTSGSDALLLDDSASPRPAGTSGPRMVSIETINMGAGNDVVDLTSTRYTYGDVTVNGGSGRDTLWTNAGDDVLDGGTGNDALAGGAGDDVYVHQANGGDDVITETSGNDTILFGPGITSRSVTVRRDDNDLVLSAGDNGSVTVRNWFGSTSRRVETVQFADGSAWSEAQLSMRANCGSYGWDFGSSTRIAGADRPNRRDSDDDDDRHRSKDDHRVKDAAEVVAALLSQKTRYDFSALAAFMSRRYGDSNGRPLSAAEVSLKWRALQRFAQGLANVDKYAKEALLGRGHADDLLQVAAAAMGWGYEGSTGSERAAGGMSSLHGLAEGFRRL